MSYESAMEERILKTFKSKDDLIRKQQAEIASMQAKIDALMLEYCPDEMTKEQMDNWEKHQKVIEYKVGK